MSYKSLLFLTSLSLTCILLIHSESQNAGRFCPAVKLRNGRVKIRGRGRISKYVCNPGFEMVGRRFATCVRGFWTNPPPVCVAPGCSLDRMKNGYHMPTHRDAFVTFFCDPGYKLEGSNSLYCDGRTWNSTIPQCIAAHMDPTLGCDFESPDLCGWSHDDQHDFEWTRHNYATPSGHVGTGPSYDHTLGEGNDGHYMYIEASSPRKENDTARLISPVYDSNLSVNGCFRFWYHMFGATTGFLMVFLKPESKKLQEITPLFIVSGNQGNKWIEGVIPLTPLEEKFQIVIQGVRGTSYVSDTAIDDVLLSNETQCPKDESITEQTPTTQEVATTREISLSTLEVSTRTTEETTTRTREPTTTRSSPTTRMTSNTQQETTRPASLASTAIKTTIPPETPASTKPSTVHTTHTSPPTTNHSLLTTPKQRTIFPRKITTPTPPELVQKPAKRSDESAETSTSPLVGVLIVGCVLLVAVIFGGAYFLHRRRQLNEARLVDDSDVRYLKDDEIEIDHNENSSL